MRSSTLDNNYKMSREEMLTMALARSGGSDVTVEALNVTQNGTYTEAGKAYSPVTVNISGYELASASGNPITLTDASALPLVECKATITATQDLNGYDKPWAGGANVNIADITYESQIVADVTITVNRDTNGNFESIVLNGTCSASQIVNLGTIAVESGETYAICDFCEGTYGGTTRTQLYGTDIILLEIYANYASGYVATGTASASGNASIRIRLNNGTTYTNVTLKPMCVKGSTISSFSPYSNICPISGTSSVTLTHNDTTTTQALSNTCYGGSYDFASGDEIVDSIKWTIETSTNQITSFGTSYCVIVLPTANQAISHDVTVNKCMCNKLKVTNYSTQYDNHIHFPNTSLIALYLSNEVGTTKQDWIDYLAQEQIEICYKIATSTTTQLSAHQVVMEGESDTLSVNTSNLEVEYLKAL